MSKAILRDNDSKFLEILVREVKILDPNALINITSIVHSHQIDIQSEKRFDILSRIKQLHYQFGLPFKATEFIKSKISKISFQLFDHENS